MWLKAVQIARKNMKAQALAPFAQNNLFNNLFFL